MSRLNEYAKHHSRIKIFEHWDQDHARKLAVLVVEDIYTSSLISLESGF